MLGERISELRKEKGLSQKQLGEILSVSKYTISSYENNKTTPDDSNKLLLARIFNVSLDYLMGLIDTPVSYDRSQDRYILLPADFDDKKVSRAQEYIDFLKRCHPKKY